MWSGVNANWSLFGGQQQLFPTILNTRVGQHTFLCGSSLAVLHHTVTAEYRTDTSLKLSRDQYVILLCAMCQQYKYLQILGGPSISGAVDFVHRHQ